MLYVCEFESGHFCNATTLAGEARGDNSPVEWQITNGSTTDVNMGPSVDHTLGTGQGRLSNLDVTSKPPASQLAIDRINGVKISDVAYAVHM